MFARRKILCVGDFVSWPMTCLLAGCESWERAQRSHLQELRGIGTLERTLETGAGNPAGRTLPLMGAWQAEDLGGEASWALRGPCWPKLALAGRESWRSSAGGQRSWIIMVDWQGLEIGGVVSCRRILEAGAEYHLLAEGRMFRAADLGAVFGARKLMNKVANNTSRRKRVGRLM